MNIIEGLGFNNFRVFTEPTNLDFAPITILTGTNNSGKSTVINGLRLIHANYKDLPNYSNLRPSDKKEKFELDSLFSKDFNVDAIIQRYGSLEKMVSFGSEKNVFSFCIQKKMRMIDDTALIGFTIAIQDNKVKNGRLTKLSISSKNTGEEIFSIEEMKGDPQATNGNINPYITNGNINPYITNGNINYYDHHVTKIDLSFYYSQFHEWIEREKIGTKIVELNNGLFYNFSFLWENNPEHEKLFEGLIKKIYGVYSAISLKNLNEDILKYLTEVEWKRKHVAAPDEDNLGVDYINFKKGFSLSLFGRSSEDTVSYEPGRKPGEFAFLTSDLIKEINERKELVELLINIIKERDKEFNTPELDINDMILNYYHPNRKKIEKGEYLPGFTSSESEKYFNDTFLFHNLTLIKESFEPFKLTEFVSADRANSNRVKSLLDKDDLSRLTKNQFLIDPEARKKIEEFTDSWFREFGIADKVIFDKDPDSEYIKIFIYKNDRKILLADMGFGATQLLPIILACFPKIENDFDLRYLQQQQYKQKVVVIEEPESNLHPALQSKLADFFINASKTFNIQFIIETHSEYLIRKLQYLTAKGEISTDDTVIYYFNMPPGEEQVNKINIQEDGSLTKDFGTGFFDEADNLAIDLYNWMTQSRKN